MPAPRDFPRGLHPDAGDLAERNRSARDTESSTPRPFRLLTTRIECDNLFSPEEKSTEKQKAYSDKASARTLNIASISSKDRKPKEQNREPDRTVYKHQVLVQSCAGVHESTMPRSQLKRNNPLIMRPDAGHFGTVPPRHPYSWVVWSAITTGRSSPQSPRPLRNGTPAPFPRQTAPGSRRPTNRQRGRLR